MPDAFDPLTAGADVLVNRPDYTENAVKTDIRSSPPAALTRLNVCSGRCLNGSFQRQAFERGIVRGRIILPFEV
ncbi:MAG TPA: hypothetical protein DEB39_14950 [Planctomycetaceae bacterium]|nr:hypothetical protein [Planctomycetaceae bacterium]